MTNKRNKGKKVWVHMYQACDFSVNPFDASCRGEAYCYLPVVQALYELKSALPTSNDNISKTFFFKKMYTILKVNFIYCCVNVYF